MLCLVEILSILGFLHACNETGVQWNKTEVDQERKSLSLGHAEINGWIRTRPLTINLSSPSVINCSNQRQDLRWSRATLLLAVGLRSPGKDVEDELPWGEQGSHCLQWDRHCKKHRAWWRDASEALCPEPCHSRGDVLDVLPGLPSVQAPCDSQQVKREEAACFFFWLRDIFYVCILAR